MYRLRLLLLVSILALCSLFAPAAAQRRTTVVHEDMGLCNPRLLSTAQTDTALTNAINSTSNPDCSGDMSLLVGPGTWVIDANLTIPNRMGVFMAHGAQFSISGGVTLTLDCGKIYAREEQIFAGTGAVACTGVPREGLSAHWRGADGVGDDQSAIQAAIDSLPAGGGKVVLGSTDGATTYTVNSEILINKDRVYLVGLGKNTTLKAGATSMSVIRFAASDGGVSGLTIDCDELASTIGLSVAPEDETQVITRVDQNFNMFENMLIEKCTDGIRQVTGPDVGGFDSGNWYNTFRHIHLKNNIRGAYLVDHATDPSASQVNRNNWIDVRFAGDGTPARANTGLHIKAGSTNTFTGVHFEGIEIGTSPSTTPTAIVIEGQSISLADNNDNVFVSSMFEANTRDIDIKTSNANTNKFIGGNEDISKVVDNGTNTFFLSTEIVTLPPVIAYDATGGRADMNPTNGVQVLGSGHQRLFINGVKATGLFGTNAQMTVTAPNSDNGYPIALFTDSLSRGQAILSNDFDDATNTGTALRLSNVAPHVQATTSGFSNGTPVSIPNNGLTMAGATLAAMTSGPPADGTITYCSDCLPNSNPCTASSTGAFAKRLNGAFDCR